MTAALAHRGPDEDGFLADGPVCLGVRRLSIIDLAGGTQPLANEDGTVRTIQNGEIYNFRELNRELAGRGHELATRSDTETIAHLYEEHGLGFASHLRGMFAIAVWDRHRRRLVIARDRYGIKPLYYRVVGGTLSFASELKALMTLPDFRRELDLGALEAYLTLNYVPAPLSIFREARKLPAGHLMVVEDGQIELREYADARPGPAAELRGESVGSLAAELTDRLRDSVRAHLVADVPVGVLLSGGIDSGMLATLAAAESSEPVKTFTIGFGERDFSEADEARLVATSIGAEHHELVVDPRATELLPRLLEVFDEPFADNAALPTYLLCQMAAEHVKVVLSGEGGDELFGGYYAYLGDLWAPRVGPAAARLSALADRLPSGSSSRRLDDRVKRFVRGSGLTQPERHVAWGQVFSSDARHELMRRREEGFDPLFAHRERWRGSAGADELARAQDLDVGIYLVDDILTKADRTSMAHSLEARVPFLDPAVTDLALALPANRKLRLLTKKLLLRRAAADLLPHEIVRARKRGFALPVARWFREDLLGFAREVLSPSRMAAQGFLNPDAVTAAIDVHVSGREDLSRNIWGLICFSLWCDRYL